MCGRFSLGIPRQEILRAVQEEHPELDLDEWVDEDVFQPRFNIAPRSRSPVVRRRNRFDDGQDVTENEDRQDKQETDMHHKVVMHTMKWGLVPHWNKHEDIKLNTINAKGEKLVEGGGMWTSIKGRKRCAIVCQGYYEWLKKGKDRFPHFTKYKDGKLLLLAGLYDRVVLEGSTEPLWTFTIVTTDASKRFAWLHDRMPVVLSTQSQLDEWLDTSSQKWSEGVANIIRPYSDKAPPLECYEVPKDVGKVGAESPTFIEPITKRRDGIQTMFAKQSKAASSSAMPASSTKSKPSFPDAGTESSTKRRRESPQPKDGRESNVELLDHPPDAKRPRHDVEEKEISSSRLKRVESTSLLAESSPKSPKRKTAKSPPKSPTKAIKSGPKTSADASPGSSKITRFFSKDSK